ncbi:hypothetical protein J2W20_000517 [Sinomonas atrocyanea]|uniref:hypothetical protein n=1 Tax=Sinomonas atrocyanea TaxID=37927 RepID=UPI0027851393|nr:hypothetical protein [Sinomonas atrocyanea]MDQ0258642.1 hypothetical protein [Sinomonas atrocyanea]
MIDRHSAQLQRARIEAMAAELGPDEPLWFEVRSARQAPGSRWKAAVGRRGQTGTAFSGEGGACVLFELDYPSQLPEWLDAVGIRPEQPIPLNWRNLVSFDCPVECTRRQDGNTPG